MDSHRFLELLRNVRQLEELDYFQLKKVTFHFPYFHLAHGLAAKYEFEKNLGKHGDSLALAALTSPDRQALKKWIESPVKIQNSEFGERQGYYQNTDAQPLTETESIIQESQDSVVNDQEVVVESAKTEKKRRSLPKDDLIESIKRREKQEILDTKKKEQIDLIREFNKKDFKMAAIKENEANQPIENLADASTRLNDNLVSETYARILIRQGKKEAAIEIYEKLALKFPDKRAYFANLIEKLKE